MSLNYEPASAYSVVWMWGVLARQSRVDVGCAVPAYYVALMWGVMSRHILLLLLYYSQT